LIVGNHVKVVVMTWQWGLWQRNGGCSGEER